MKPSVLLLFLLLFNSYLKSTATNSSLNTAPTLYEQLCDLNKYWCAHPSSDPYMAQPTEFADPEKLIRLHLATVENTLRHADTRHLSAKQAGNRAHCLDILRSYWLKGVFPKNTNHTYMVPYFIDRYNTACAVGHLIRETGYEAIAKCISEEMNYAYIEQMPYPEIGQWADEMGFSVAELKWIQPAYMPPFLIQTSSSNADCGNNNGSLEASLIPLNGNIEPNSINWYKINNNLTSLVGQSAHVNNASSGLYKIAVTSIGTMFPYMEKLAAISDNEGPQITAEIQNETCFAQKDGRITISISGGAAPYNTTWYNANGQIMASNTTVLENLLGLHGNFMEGAPTPSTYFVEVRDANNCTTYEPYQVNTLYPESPNAWLNILQQPTCNGSNGSLQVLYYEPNSTIAWSHDPTLSTDIASNLPAGFYTVTVTTPTGCSQVTGMSLSNIEAFPPDFITNFWVSSIYCGQVLGTIQCPTGNYTYHWSHNPDLNTATATDLEEGIYKITITNNSGCQFLFQTNITTLYTVYSPPSITINNVNSATGTLGSIDLGYIPSYYYNWSHNASLDTSFVNNLVAGLYSVTISDDFSCSQIFNFEIVDENPLFIGSQDWNNGNNVTLSANRIGGDLLLSYTSLLPLNDPTFTLYDLTGRRLQQTAAPTQSGKTTSMNIAALNSGIYLVELRSNGKHQCIKIMLTD